MLGCFCGFPGRTFLKQLAAVSAIISFAGRSDDFVANPVGIANCDGRMTAVGHHHSAEDGAAVPKGRAIPVPKLKSGFVSTRLHHFFWSSMPMSPMATCENLQVRPFAEYMHPLPSCMAPQQKISNNPPDWFQIPGLAYANHPLVAATGVAGLCPTSGPDFRFFGVVDWRFCLPFPGPIFRWGSHCPCRWWITEGAQVIICD